MIWMGEIGRGVYYLGRVIRKLGGFISEWVNPLMWLYMRENLTERRLKSKGFNGCEIFIVFDDSFEYFY